MEPVDDGALRRDVPVGHGEADERGLQRLLGGVIGMAWVPAQLAQDGASVTIVDEEDEYEASVVTRPFYDPDGAVLRS